MPYADKPTALPDLAEVICAARSMFPVRDAIVIGPCSVVMIEDPEIETFPLPTRERFPLPYIEILFPVRLRVPGVEELPVAIMLKVTFGLSEMVEFWISIFGA